MQSFGGTRQQSPGRLLGLVFFGSLVLWVVVTIVTILSPSSGTAKAASILGVVAAGSFFALLGALIVGRIESLRGTAPAAPAAAVTPPPGGPPRTSFQG